MMDETNTLPPDLIECGYKLIVRAPGRMFAVSTDWGCTGTKATVQEVVSEARSMIKFIDWAKRNPLEVNDE